MESSIVTYAALACAVLAAVAGFAAQRNARGRSAGVFTAAAVLAAAGFAGGLITDSPDLFAAGACIGMLMLAVGLALQAKEHEVVRQLAAAQRVDHISGLPNEVLFYERLTAEHSRTKRTHQRYSIAVFEIDDYALLAPEDKTNGLRLLADSLGESIRNTDTLGRIGDHRVAVLLVDTLADGAVVGCDRACERFFFQSCGHDEAAHVSRPLTVSAGIAAFDDDIVDPGQVVDNAALALKQLRDRLETGIRIYDRHQFGVQRESALMAPFDD
ncbi:MAG: diguanylate cyclase [Solirubrobacterales bacterium]